MLCGHCFFLVQLSQEACIQLIRRLTPAVSESEALSVLQHSRQSPLEIRQQLEALTRMKQDQRLVQSAIADRPLALST